MPTYSHAEQSRQRAAVSPTTQWRREAETWFDGSVESVDRRLAACERLLVTAREAVAHQGFNSDAHKRLSAIGDLTDQRTILGELRRDLLTAASDREAIYGDPAAIADGEHAHEQWRAGEEFGHHQEPPSEQFIHEPGFHEGGISVSDRRYVELESAKFFRANSDVPADELAIRARYHAELQTSTFTQSRSRAVTAAFVRRVTQFRQETPRPRVAMAASRSMDFPPELLFM